MVATIYQNNVQKTKEVFIEGITFCRKNLQYDAGKSLSQNVFSLFATNQIPLDEAPYYLAQITDFYKVLEKHQDAIEALCAAASYFADVSAFQSAYRAIQDAQEISMVQNVLESQIRILETQGIVALAEGDLDCAEGEFRKCFEIYKSNNEIPTFQLKANAALVKLRKEDYGAAKDIYETLLNDCQVTSEATDESQIRLNLLVCYRELGDISAVEDILRQVEMSPPSVRIVVASLESL